MARKGRGLLITLCVIIGIFVVAVVALRLFLTREKLLAIMIPRVEKAVDAKVSIGDIGINFPFGLGVDIDELRFDKTLPDTSTLEFSSKKVTVRSSLMSLLRRQPEIKAADVKGGTVIVGNARKRLEIRLLGLDSHLSMKPAGEGFSVGAKALIDSVLVSMTGAPPAITLLKIGFDGEMESDRELTRLVVKDSKVSWEDLFTAKIKGEVTNIKTAPRVALTVESDKRPLGPIFERVKSFKLDELVPAKKQAGQRGAERIPVEMSGGTFGFNAQIEGLAKEPLSMDLSFEGAIEDLAVKAGNLASIAKVNAEFKGQGVAIAWKGLFPASGAAAPADISLAWQAVKLDGTVKLEGGDFEIQNRSSDASASSEPVQAQPIRISGLKAEAGICGPDIRKLSGELNIGSSPYKFEASMINIMPATAELALIARNAQGADQKGLSDLGAVLDRMANAPVVKLEVNGRSFDARPYEKPSSGASTAGKATAPAAAQTSAKTQMATEQTSAAAAGSGAVLFLKNTTFTVKLDSIIAREAVITGLNAKGTIRDGRVKVDPATFAYAGGSGKTVVSADLRKTGRVETKVDFSAEGVEAGQALAHFNALGGLIEGKFSVSSNAALVSGSGVNILKTLSAAGAALSSKGTVSFAKFVEPLTNIQGFDVTPFKKFDFNDWRGSFVVKDGRFISDNWKIKSSRGDWSIKGSFGFDGTLDYAVHVVIPPDVQNMMKGIDRYKSAFDLMRDKSGNLVLDIKLAGTANRPSASLDLTQAKGKVQDKLVDELKKRFLR
jgi:hypothetical protein